MNQTGFILFVLLAAFGVYITQKGELGTYAGFFFTSGSDAVASNSSTPGNSASSPAGGSGSQISSSDAAEVAELAAIGG